MRQRLGWIAAVALASIPWPAAAEKPVFPEHAPPLRFGSVLLDVFSTKAGMAPVTFDHWRHRGLYTCRLCHVDVGFAMQARATQVSAASNRSGLHCGACHNGRTRFADSPIFASCDESPARPPPAGCERCHGNGQRPGRRQAYEAYVRALPKDASDLVDWEEAERRAFRKPEDYVEGVSLRPDRLAIDKNFAITTLGTWLGEVKFNHQRHARWSGCEACHPEIFPTTKRGGTAYKMKDIVAGEFCGACHNKVAFPVASCLRCHERPPR